MSAPADIGSGVRSGRRDFARRAERRGAARGEGSDAMAEPLVFVDNSEVREGKLEELKTAIKDLAKFARANEPRPVRVSH